MVLSRALSTVSAALVMKLEFYGFSKKAEVF